MILSALASLAAWLIAGTRSLPLTHSVSSRAPALARPPPLPAGDGNSFASNLDDPIDVVALGAAAGTKIWFRGRANLDAVLDTLAATRGLADAEVVLQTGASAGGLAAFLHADYVHQRLKTIAPSMIKYRAAPISGVLPRPSVFLV